MDIGGWQKISFIDYPEKVSTVIFTQGCNFRCGYCHNKDLILKNSSSMVDEKEIISFLKKRKNVLDGVVISGGEPTLQENLIPFLLIVKNLGYTVKLDTNGSKPSVIEECIDLNLVDYIAMDVKNVLDKDKYKKVCGVNVYTSKIEKSINIIYKAHSLGYIEGYHFRTTYDTSLISKNAKKEIKKEMKFYNHIFQKKR